MKHLTKCKHFDEILDIGCGYGRHARYLSEDKKFTCNNYYGIDISEYMLRRMLKVKKEEYNFFPQADVKLICMAVEKLPFDDNSIDFVFSSSVFIHMDKEKVKNTVLEVGRVLKPGGVFAFEDSFFNKNSPGNVVRNFLRKLTPGEVNTSYLNQFSLSEVESLLKQSPLVTKSPGYTIKSLRPEIIPVVIRGARIPLAEQINQMPLPDFMKDSVAGGYSVYSDNFY